MTSTSIKSSQNASKELHSKTNEDEIEIPKKKDIYLTKKDNKLFMN